MASNYRKREDKYLEIQSSGQCNKVGL